MAKLVRRLNIQRIRSEKKITQKELAEKTGFPQGYISKMERGIVSTSEMFINKVKEVFAIENIDDYVSFKEQDTEVADNEQEFPIEPPVMLNRHGMNDKMMIERLFNMIDRRDARIEKLESEIERLRKEVEKYKS